MYKLICMFVIMFSVNVIGLAQQSLTIFEPTLYSMEALQYFNRTHIPAMGKYEDKADQALSVQMNNNLIRYQGLSVFHNNRFHLTTTDTKKVRHVGWEYKLGIGLDFLVNKRIEMGHYHHSEHITETYSPTYPLQDAYFLNVIFYKKD